MKAGVFLFMPELCSGGVLGIEHIESSHTLIADDRCQMRPVADKTGSLSRIRRPGEYDRQQFTIAQLNNRRQSAGCGCRNEHHK